jgi:3alpha(or 20beta)-hydroxysteroid dehydrogenase
VRSEGRLAGRVVVVTGGARGLGLGIARTVAEAGAAVVSTDLTATDTADEDPGTEFHVLDVTDPAGWSALAGHIRDRYGRLDGLVNNAGITIRARVGDIVLDDLERAHRVNLAGPVLGMQALAPLMAPGGSIVNIGSAAALTGHYPVAYTASKWALRGATRAASVEFGARGIRVNAVHPGFIETPMTASAPAPFRDANLRETPLRRLGSVDDVAPLIVFLLSSESTYISGADIPSTAA